MSGRMFFITIVTNGVAEKGFAGSPKAHQTC